MTQPVGSTGMTSATTPSDVTYVTVTQPDGKTYRIPQTKATWDPVNETWVSNASPEAIEQGKLINRKYGQALDADDFMKLLVAQMRYQDPSKPADTTAMMQQTASMAMLERVNEMTDSAKAMADAAKDLKTSNDELLAYYVSNATENRMSTAVGMIGATISYADPADASKTLEGVVESVKFSPNGPILTVSGQDVPLGSVTGVKQPATTPAATTPTTNTTGSAPSAGTGGIATDGTSDPTGATAPTGSTGPTA